MIGNFGRSEDVATEINSWEIINGKLVPVDTSLAANDRKETEDLEEWIFTNPEIIGNEIALFGRQVYTKSGPLDIIGIDKNGYIVIIELKRDRLPREALSQAIDYASDIATWTMDKINEVCLKNTDKSIEDFITDTFEDVSIENLSVNQVQRILLVGFRIEESLERMISWLSETYSVNINAIVLNYIKTQNGSELLNKTSIIPEEIEKERAKKKKFTIPMSDEPGDFEDEELEELLTGYFRQDMKSARRIKNVLIPVCLKHEVVTREELKTAFIEYDEPNAQKNAGYFVSLISQQIGMEKNSFLRQIISYDYPNYRWEKDNYQVKDEYRNLLNKIIGND